MTIHFNDVMNIGLSPEVLLLSGLSFIRLLKVNQWTEEQKQAYEIIANRRKSLFVRILKIKFNVYGLTLYQLFTTINWEDKKFGTKKRKKK